MTDVKADGSKELPSTIRITVIIQDRFTLDTDVMTGKQIKEKANIPAGFSLYRRAKGGNESIGDDAPLEVHNGDHFYAQPLSQPGVGHREEQ
jgi:hypothetical protein